ncbi:aldo/keto reductase [Tessaracoccus antarcticus]|uniref:Aldo/keto reductase n=1 Tax=Tessaracoccus antarcticus TaxID=2479848 RepID=A0A3M0GW99_9ACTN|nr:aldo/keto reductase [Tessaracoccus antarcticus]RMB61626.1 aldo/keto reductase [Tessaracoccus antarcticus]
MTKTKRSLGQFTVSPIGLGAMPSSMSGGELPGEAQAIETIRAALDAGITLIDTADIYAPSWDQMGHNERLVAKALKAHGGRPDDVVIATKGGITRSAEGWGRDGSAEYLRTAVQKSLEALELDFIDLYYVHRPDRQRLYSETIEALSDLRSEGLIKEIGISNANVEEIQVAVDVLGDGGLAAVQNEFSPKFHHTSKPELDFCGEHGIAFLPWSPLGGTSGGAKRVGESYPAIAKVAAAHDVSPQQVTLAWELSLGGHVIPIPGASRPETIRDSALAANLELSAEELSSISAAVLR